MRNEYRILLILSAQSYVQLEKEANLLFFTSNCPAMARLPWSTLHRSWRRTLLELNFWGLDSRGYSMKYLCLGYMSDAVWQAMSPREQESFTEECLAYDKELLKKGHWEGNGTPLENVRSAKTVRMAKGQLIVTDGPYAESKEQLGSLSVLVAEDMEEAVALISKHPCLRLGSFEIRPIDPDLLSGCTPANTPDDPADGQKVICLGCFNETAWDALSPTALEALRNDCMAYAEVLHQGGGTAVLGAALQGAKTAKTLRQERGKVMVTDGPFAETKEQIGGVAIYRFRDMDQALAAWRDHPCLHFGDTFELRPADEANAAKVNAKLATSQA